MAAPNLQHGRQAAQVTVTVYEDNALSVSGDISDPVWTIAALENAIDAIRNQHRPKTGNLVIPQHDVSLPDKNPVVIP